MNNRRKLLVALGAGALTTPLTTFAQAPGRMYRLGILGVTSVSSPAVKRRQDVFRAALRELGYIDGNNIVFESRWAEEKLERLRPLAAELVLLKVDVIVADGGTPSILAAKEATHTIPIVFPTAGDPVASGLVSSLARPGGNLTGLSLQSPEVVQKRLELLKEIVPAVKRIAYLIDPQNPTNAPTILALQSAAKTRELEIHVIEVATSGNFDAAFAEMARKRVDVVIISPNATLNQHASRLADLARKLKLPTISENPILVEHGALASFGANSVDMARRAAVMVDKILKGAKPADLPVEQPTKFELVINMKTAKALGIKIPNSILVRAEKVIE